MLRLGASVLLVMAVIRLGLLPRRSLSSMAAGFVVLVGCPMELLLVMSLGWTARLRRDLRDGRYWMALGIGILACLPMIIGLVRYAIA